MSMNQDCEECIETVKHFEEAENRFKEEFKRITTAKRSREEIKNILSKKRKENSSKERHNFDVKVTVKIKLKMPLNNLKN